MNGNGVRKFTGQPLQAPDGWKEEGSERGIHAARLLPS